ncbi:S9 family peptidase [Hyphobacterium sp. HN65]|uniref:S9 family peptidase n=1 Tax=Hyphobacterium lacteum TaxID=3116575 RepID=A0ABU7LR12_9PROT|nr:S9 family peptidase [Hyphobacterium sp. HN65]MEE2526354.1 S9 family peptidase [Hyphobacterium sp. HN65]
MPQALLLAASALLIQDAEPAELTLERLYASPSLNGPVATATRFSPDGGLITFLQGKEEDANVRDLWAIDVEGGDPFLLVDSRVLAPEERELTEAEIQLRERARITGSGIVTYDWDARGDALLFPLDGDVFYYELESGDAQRLMETEAAETDARISPAGRYVGYVRDQNLFVHDLRTGETSAITSDGGGTLTYATAEFVAQEEMRRSTGYWFSRDDRYVAFTEVDESPIPVSYRVDISGDGASIVEQRYPYAGEANVGIRLFIEEIETGERVEANLGENADIYLARANWGPDGRLYIQRQNRAQTQLDLIAFDPETGEGDIVLTETDPAWVNLTNDLAFLEDGSFLWTSERTGFRHIYHYAADGTALGQLTSGDWQINAIEGVNRDAGLVFFSGWMTDPRQRHLYSVSYIQPDAEPVRITSGDGWWSGISMGAGAQTFIASYSDPDTPTNTALYDASGERLRWIEENALEAGHPYFPYLENHAVPAQGSILAEDGTELLYDMYLPPNFDPSQAYPVIINVYGGPGVGRRTRMIWSGATNQYIAQQGYIYFMLDNRGSPDRGHAFETALHRSMGGVEVADQLAGLAYLRSLDFVDPDRIGIWGWSYGGYMTLMTTLQAPGEFAAGVAGAPVTDWALYDTHYTERYMGTPQNNPDGYEQSSVFAHLDGWETPLLIMHGMADDNVVFENTTRLINELQGNDLPFELMTYPGQRHGIRGEMRSRHRLRTMMEFFDRHLQPAD